MNAFYRLYRFLARILFFLLTRRRVISGLDYVPREGPLILISNHFSLVDPIVLMAYFPRQVYFMAKAEVFESFPLKWLAPLAGAFPVHRGKVDRTALRRAEELLQAGLILGIYPEGTRSHSGTVQSARAGVVLLAQRTGAAILPVGVCGTERIGRKGFPFLRWTTVTLSIGQPFRLEELAEDPRQADRQVLASMMMERVALLLPPAYRAATLGDQQLASKA